MSKFKEGDEVVRTRNGRGAAPIGYKSIVETREHSKDLVFTNANGELSNFNEQYWELAEDTNKPVTVTHEGNVYELGQHYLFGSRHQLHKLLKIDKLSDYPFRVIDEGQENGFKKVHLVNLDAGTITPAPIELIDGAAYMFDEKAPYSNKDCIGIYEYHKRKFHLKNYNVFVGSCTNIRPMTVAESK
ncbi:MAG: hypothetical protein ACI9HU_000628 [Colwellia sp.]|jgi:hypothetical protein